LERALTTEGACRNPAILLNRRVVWKAVPPTSSYALHSFLFWSCFYYLAL
jgi:hypothetical protein